ncbi:MAG: hypothetical protein K2G45_10265 [Lachnospiraceae bacterium]|nr:hypothetical protein [Lachnospiraceae bacterium]
MNIVARGATSRYEYYTNRADKVKNGQSVDNTEELFGKRNNDVPYGYLANDGIITYRGVVFVCDEENNCLLLGDCSNPNNCINVPLSGGGNLIFNRNNIGSISQAIGMFSPEDVSRIMKAIAEDAKSKQVQNEIDEEVNETVGGLADSANGASDKTFASDVKETSNDDRIDDYDTNMSASDSSKVDYMKQVQEKIEEIYQKLVSGDTEVSYQIDGEDMTEKEWEMLLAKFDDIQEDIRVLTGEEQEKTVEDKKIYALDLNGNVLYDMPPATLALISEITICWYSDDASDVTMYMTCYREDGIFCMGEGASLLWRMEFSESDQYEKVMNFLSNFNTRDNLRFAAHENFWKDFLDGALDTEEFMDFWSTTNNGIPKYTKTVGASTFIDYDKAKFAKYMNSSSFAFMK